MKFVINDCFGGYGLSLDFLNKYGKEIGGLKRNDPKLVAAVEEFGEEEASGFAAKLCIKEIPATLPISISGSMTEQRP